MGTNRRHKKKRGVLGDILDRLPIVAGMVFSGLFLGYIFFTEEGIPLYLQMTDTAKQLESRIQHIEERNQFLAEEIRRVQSDPLKLEELARNRLGMVREGETVYQFVEPRLNSSRSTP